MCASTDFHLRYLIRRAREESKDTSILGNIRPLVKNAYAIVDANFDKFLENEFSADLLVQFAEVAVLVPRESLNLKQITRALDLHDRCQVAANQFVARGYLVRAQVAGVHDPAIKDLKGDHLVTQIKYALSFLSRALKIAEMPQFKARYNFIVFNASLLYWDIVRPLCRINGWQARVLGETKELLDALTAVCGQIDGYVQHKTPAAPQWRIEFMLNLAFGQDDNGQTGDAQKVVEEAFTLLKTVEAGGAGADFPPLPFWVRPLVEAARAHVFRSNAKTVLGGDPHSISHFIQNKGISAPNEIEAELLKYWNSFDPDFQQLWTSQGKAEVGRTSNDLNMPETQIKLATALKAAAVAGNFNLANMMYERIMGLRAPPPRGRILIDMSKAQIDVWQATNLIEYKKETGMILSPAEQVEREVAARVKAVRLCEQCIVAGKRIESLDLVEESATLVYNFSVPLLQTQYRDQVAKSLSRAAEVLAELQSNLFILRTVLHYEAARCEISSDLLTKGQEELNKAKALDNTLHVERELPEPKRPKPASEEELAKTGTQLDPAPFTRRMRTQQMEPLSHLLKWKLSLYDDPAGLYGGTKWPRHSVDQIMLWLDQQPVTANVISKAYNKLVVEEFEPLYRDIAEDGLRHKYVKLPQWIEAPTVAIEPYNSAHAPCTVLPTDVDVAISKNSMDTRSKSDRELGIKKIKLIAMLFAQCSARAWEKKMEYKKVAEMCDRALFIEKFVAFGPWPAEIEEMAALTQAAFRKAEVLCEELDSVCGLSEETVYALFADPEEQMVDLEPEEYAERNQTKRTIVDLILYGLEMADRFKQDWLVFNGIVHFWNFHLPLFDALAEYNARQSEAAIQQSLGQTPAAIPPLVFLNDFFRGVRVCFTLADKYFLPAQSTVLRNLALLYMDSFPFFAAASAESVNASSEKPDLPPIATDPLLQALLTKLRKTARKEVAARLTKTALSVQGPATAVAINPALAPDAGNAQLDKKLLYPDMAFGGAPLELEGNRKTELRIEGDVTKLCEQIAAVSLQNDKVMPLVTQCVDMMNTWQPRFEDEEEATLFLELWTRLGRNCLACFSPDVNKTGPKYGLMCGIRALRGLDVKGILLVEDGKGKKKKKGSRSASPRKEKDEDPTKALAVTPVARRPPNCSDLRSGWRGAAFALCGASLATLVNPSAQEKNSVQSLRYTAVLQFAAALEHCTDAELHGGLALYSAQRLYNIASSLLQTDRQSRLFVLKPLLTAGRVLSELKLNDDPELLLSIYSAAFSVFADIGEWAKIQLVLNAAFRIVPLEFQRKLWALRMVALSKQGKNVQVAMGKMKESQATAQANIWIILAHSAVRPQEQLDAYQKAIDILQKANQYSVVDVKLEFADWLNARNEELAAYYTAKHAADLLLDVEEDAAEEKLEDEAAMTGSVVSSQRGSQSRSKSAANKSKAPGSVAGSKKSGSGSKGGKSGSVMSRARSNRSGSRAGSSAASSSRQSKNALMNANDTAIPAKLNGLHYEHVLRANIAQLTYARSADDLHSALTACVHFVTKIFESTLELANQCAVCVYDKKIADLIEEQEKKKAKLENQLAGGAEDEPVVAKPMAPSFCGASGFLEYGAVYDTASFGTAEMSELEKGNSKILLDRVAFAKTNFQLVVSMLERGLPTVADKENCTVEEYFYAGKPDMFAKPVLTFWSLIQLETALENQGYDFYVFPVLDLRQLLVNQYWGAELADFNRVNAAMTTEQLNKMTVYEKEQKTLKEGLKKTLKEALDCLIALKRSRFCHKARMLDDSGKHWARAKGFLYGIEKTLPSFRAEADAAFARRVVVEEKTDPVSGADGADSPSAAASPDVDQDDLTKLLRTDKDPKEDKPLTPDENLDLSSVFADESRASPWRCGDRLKISEVWLLLARECLEIGEYSIAGRLLAETRYHARCYGDTKTFREASILQAKVMIAEGRAELVLREIMRLQYRVKGLDVHALVDVVDLAQLAYNQTSAPSAFLEDLLKTGLGFFADVRKAEVQSPAAMLRLNGEEVGADGGANPNDGPAGSPAFSPTSRTSRRGGSARGSDAGKSPTSALSVAAGGAHSPSSVMTGAAYSSVSRNVRNNSQVLAEIEAASQTANVEKLSKLCRLLELETSAKIQKLKRMQVNSKDYFRELNEIWAMEEVLLVKLINSGCYCETLRAGLRFGREMEAVLDILENTYDPGQLVPAILLQFEDRLLLVLDYLNFPQAELTKKTPSSVHLAGNCGPLSDTVLELELFRSRHRAQRRVLQAKNKLYQKGGSSSSTAPGSASASAVGTMVSAADGGGAPSSSASTTASKLASYFQLPGSPAAAATAVPLFTAAKRGFIDVEGFYKKLKPVEAFDVKDAYLEEITARIDSESERASGPRPCAEIDKSLSSVHSAYAELEYHKRSSRYPALWEGAAAQSEFVFVPERVAAAEVELGVLMLERGPRPFDDTTWDETGKNVRVDFERRAMLAEDCRSCEIAEPPKNWEALAFAPPMEGEDVGLVAPSSKTKAVPEMLLTGVEYLRSAAKTCLKNRHFKAGALACAALVNDFYGPNDMKMSFHFLCMAQLFRVLQFGYGEIMPAVLGPDNTEKMLTYKMRALDAAFARPDLLPAYVDLVDQFRSQPSGELVETLSATLPETMDEVIRETMPPLTLFVTLQLEKDYLMVGAAFFAGKEAAPNRVKAQFSTNPPTGEAEYMCFKVPARRLDFVHLRTVLYDVYGRTEKDLIGNFTDLNKKTVADYDTIMHDLETFFEPLFGRLKQEFFPLASQGERRPINLVLLPDDVLFDVPFEHLKCVERIFPRKVDAFLTRDLALPLLAVRNARNLLAAEASGGANNKPPETIPLPAVFAEEPSRIDPKDPKLKRFTLAFENTMARAFVDANNEDQYLPQETGNLLKDFPTTQPPAAVAKTFGNPEISAQAFMESLQLSKSFTFVGFSKLLMSLSSKQFGGLDLRNLDCLMMFCRAMNDRAFRRQKALFGDNLLANSDSTYSTAVLATLRGVKSMVFTQAPVPVTQVQRLSADVLNALYANKSTLSEALREPLYRVKFDSVAEVADPAEAAAYVSGSARPSSLGEKVPYLGYQKCAMIIVGLGWAFFGDAAKKK